MRYTVKQVAKLAGVSVRALHYYDEIGLLTPEAVGENGYRYYGDDALLRLQQILFFKEMELSLEEIRAILRRPGFDVIHALELHRQALIERSQRLTRLLQTIDDTIEDLKGEQKMPKKKLFAGFSDEKQKEYEVQVRQKYGEHAFDGVRDWNTFSAVEKEQVKREGEAIYQGLVECLEAGLPPESDQAQALTRQRHKHIEYFYKCSFERFLALAKMYGEDPDFTATFQAMHPNMVAYVLQATTYYCKVNGGIE